MTYNFIDALKDAELDALKKELVDAIDSLGNDDLVSMYNEYAEANNYEKIYSNDETGINELFGESSPWDVVNSLASGYVSSDAYCMFNGSGLLESSWEPEKLACIESDKIADFIIDYQEDFNISDIADILEKYEEIGEKHWEEE